jgi:GNAT superfamily N-acetyltransferase
MAKRLDSAGLTFRQDYFGDPAGWAALVCLLKDIFGIDIGPLQQLGGPDPTSMPFGWFDAEGELAANISAFALPFVLNGRIVHAAGLQSGAVRPPWRGRGLYRDVTVKALEWCEKQGFEAVILYTDKPSLYEAYGSARYRCTDMRERHPPLRLPPHPPGRFYRRMRMILPCCKRC